MSDENNEMDNTNLDDPDFDDAEMDDLVFDDLAVEDEDEYAIDTVENTLERFMDVASVDAVFGEPIEKGDLLLIPVAEVGSAMGFGVGTGYGQAENSQTAGGAGGGGGGWNFSRPVAVIIASSDSVQIQPVVDVTKLAIAALTTLGFMTGLMLRMLRPSRH